MSDPTKGTQANGYDKAETDGVEFAKSDDRGPGEGSWDADTEPDEEPSPVVDEEKQELRDKYVRLYAEFENYRKRVAREREELLDRATEKVVADILTVLDHLELALQHRDQDSLEALIQGVESTVREFTSALERNGVTPIEAKGKPFDPAVHHAMTQIETAEVEENQVVEEFRRGFRLKDRVLRPSLVAVAKRPATVSEPGGGEEESGE